jgi:hypothetical protein
LIFIVVVLLVSVLSLRHSPSGGSILPPLSDVASPEVKNFFFEDLEDAFLPCFVGVFDSKKSFRNPSVGSPVRPSGIVLVANRAVGCRVPQGVENAEKPCFLGVFGVFVEMA